MTGGCPKCVYENLSTLRAKPQDQYIKECQEIHKNRYDYSKVVYVNGNKKVTIICNVHGEFKQQAGAHLLGRGCPACNVYKNEAKCRQILEKLTGENFIKERPKFLNKLEYDGYNDDLKLAFEYNGEQHYEYIPFFHSNKKANFERQKANDKLKIELSHKNGIYLIIIPYWITDKEKFIYDEYQNYLFLTTKII